MILQTDHPHPVMTPEFLTRQVGPLFDQSQRYLEPVETHGSPLYLLDSAKLADQAARFRVAFASRLPATRFYFAVKSNNMPDISRILIREGFGLDVSSGLELAAALEMGAEDIIFSGPGKTRDELMRAAAHPDRVTLLMDSVGECRRFMAILAEKRQALSAGIRLNCQPEGLWQKFGILPDQVSSLIQEILAHPFLSCSGIQFHSSWNLTPDRQKELIRQAGALIGHMPADFLAGCRFIDIGGGYWPETGEWLVSDDPLCHYHLPAASVDTFAQELSNAVTDHVMPHISPVICFEPGRWICHDAVHIVVQVIDKKMPDMVITDAGTNAVGWERFETDYFPVLNLTRPGLTEHPCRILGSLCTPHDVWGYSFFGSDIQEGDILMIPFQGAYTYSLRQSFIKPLPKTVVI